MPGYSHAATRYDEDVRKVGCARRVVGEQSAFGMCTYQVQQSWTDQSLFANILYIDIQKLDCKCSGSAAKVCANSHLQM